MAGPGDTAENDNDSEATEVRSVISVSDNDDRCWDELSYNELSDSELSYSESLAADPDMLDPVMNGDLQLTDNTIQRSRRASVPHLTHQERFLRNTWAKQNGLTL